MVGKTDRKAERERRHARVRTKISGTAERPRLCVYRSNKNLFVQVIDDVNGTTLAAANGPSLNPSGNPSTSLGSEASSVMFGFTQ